MSRLTCLYCHLFRTKLKQQRHVLLVGLATLLTLLHLKNLSCFKNCVLKIPWDAGFVEEETIPNLVEFGNENNCHHRHCHQEYLIILAVVGGLIFFTTLAVVIWLLVYWRNNKRKRSRKLFNPAELALVPPSWRVFTREELKTITIEGNRLLGDAKTGAHIVEFFRTGQE